MHTFARQQPSLATTLCYVETEGTTSAGGRKPRSARKIVLRVGLVLVVLAGLIGVGGYVLANRYDAQIKRADLLPSQSDPPRVDGPMNILVIGSDKRTDATKDDNDPSSNPAAVTGERSDTMILVHLNAAMDKAYAVSFHRDLFVPIATKDGKEGSENKLNSAFSDGGAPRLVSTLQYLTGVRIDHVVIVDFSAIRKITDAVGGVDVYVNETTTDPRSKRTFTKGMNHLDGVAAEAYVRQRYNLPRDDYDRIGRQQQYLAALLKKVTSLDVLTNPVKLDQFLSSVTSSLTVNGELPVKNLVFTLRDIRMSDVSFLTVPTSGDGYEYAGSVVYYDEDKANALWKAFKDDNVQSYVDANGSNDVSAGP